MIKLTVPLRRFLRLENNGPRPVVTVAHRFLEAFQDHGVGPSQIPRLLPQIKLGDLHSPERLLAVLTPETLAEVAKRFGIRQEWLEGIDDVLYPCLATYKQPLKLLKHLAAILPTENCRFDFPFRVLTSAMRLDFNNDDVQELAPILVERVAELGEETIYRYHVYQDGFDWGHQPARIQLKAMARVAYKSLRTPVPLFRVSPQVMKAIREGRLNPRHYLSGCQLTNPSLEDYALSREESAVAKEVEELPEVLRYIEAEHLLDIRLAWKEPPPDPIPAEAEPSPPQPAPKALSKRERSKTEWEKVEAYAQSRWAEDPAIGIANMIETIQSIKNLKMASLSPSAIRKHIAEFAPADKRKAGRRAKKSP